MSYIELDDREQLRLMKLGIIPVIQMKAPEVVYSNVMILPAKPIELASGPTIFERPKGSNHHLGLFH